jgi:hypothetical protein
MKKFPGDVLVIRYNHRRGEEGISLVKMDFPVNETKRETRWFDMPTSLVKALLKDLFKGTQKDDAQRKLQSRTGR